MSPEFTPEMQAWLRAHAVQGTKAGDKPVNCFTRDYLVWLARAACDAVILGDTLALPDFGVRPVEWPIPAAKRSDGNHYRPSVIVDYVEWALAEAGKPVKAGGLAPVVAAPAAADEPLW